MLIFPSLDQALVVDDAPLPSPHAFSDFLGVHLLAIVCRVQRGQRIIQGIPGVGRLRTLWCLDCIEANVLQCLLESDRPSPAIAFPRWIASRPCIEKDSQHLKLWVAIDLNGLATFA